MTPNRLSLLSLFFTCLCISKLVLIKTIFVVLIGDICLNPKNFHTDGAHVLCSEKFIRMTLLQMRKERDNKKPLFFQTVKHEAEKKKRETKFPLQPLGMVENILTRSRTVGRGQEMVGKLR